MIGERLKELRTQKNLTIAQAAEALGMNANTYAKYERNERDVSTDGLCQIAEFYNATSDYLLGRAPQLDPMKLLVAQTDTSPEALEKQYEALPEEYQALVMAVIRAMKETRKQRQAAKKPQTVWIKQHQNKAAAGFGYDLSDKDEWYDVEVVETPQTIEADFAVEIEGDSMEPDFHSGELALIKFDPDVPVGEVGLFVLDGMGYIKERGKKKLISRNKDYPDIEGEARCIGLVIGIAETV